MRTEFLWLIYDHIQKNPERLNDATEIAREIMGATTTTHKGKVQNRIFERVAEDALGCLKVAGLIRHEHGAGYHPRRWLDRKQFGQMFE